VTDSGAGRGPVRGTAGTPLGLDGLTEEILPALIARLRASRLAELEVRSDGWRVRLRRDLRQARRSRSPSGDGEAYDDEDTRPMGEARSPAVGYFSPSRQLVVGHTVAAGDTLGSVDVLGIAQDVTAPMGGIISAVLAEVGQAVEYGQALAEIDPLDADLEPTGDVSTGSPAAGESPAVEPAA
jgi:biotin carboxyl carrier protein